MSALVQTAPVFADVHAPAAGRVALKGFFAITDKWALPARDQQVLLGGIGRTTFAKYRKLPEVALARDTLERISYIFGIHKALLVLFGSEKRATAWLRKPNTDHPFNGRSALDRMLAGSVVDLAAVRDYLDAVRG
ncbi:MAG: MbcA/ParS/Xre antitoxin family protein [Opitutaceae bacterium]